MPFLKLKLLPFYLFILLVILTQTKSTFAEIATTKDWVGLFEQSKNCSPDAAVRACRNQTVPTASGSPFSDGYTWVYTSSCTQTAGSTPAADKLQGCNLTPDPFPTSGTFEYRLYANDTNYLLATSARINATPAPSSGGGGGPNANIECPTQSPYPRVVNGLISAPTVGTNFGNYFSGATKGICAQGNKISFAPYKIPTYDDLKSLYYTQAKTSTTVIKEIPRSAGPINLGSGEDHLYNITGDLTISSPSDITGSQTGIIFVEGNLTIGQIPGNKVGNNNSGLVFIVKGNVTVDQSITEIDAVIISGGTIYTAGEGCSLASSSGADSQLVVNGSLISLNQSNNIVFCRKLGSGDSTTPAEKIIQQPKYLVILKDLFSDTLQKWSEI